VKDRELLEPMLIPLLIIGSKYDIFQVSRLTQIKQYKKAQLKQG